MTGRNIRISNFDRLPPREEDVEIVERKGLGHPDSLSDGIAERVAQHLCRAYRERFGHVLHFNTDETQLVAGRSEPAFGGGEMHSPIYILLVGRATQRYNGTAFPAESIAMEAAREYIEETVPRLEVGTDVVLDVRLGEGSGDLKEVFSDKAAVPAANDTSFGVGFAPLTDTERVVLEAERQLNSEFASTNPALGSDIKVMGKREDDDLYLTIAAAIIDEFVEDLDAYRSVEDEIKEFVLDVAARETGLDVSADVNTADDYEDGSIYLTVSGTSAEMGDDGSVGRGNRANGLITPNRSMSLEATSGKNPVNHIGKIYNLLAKETAEDVVDEVNGIRDLRIRLLSQIGQPIDQPQIADVHVIPEADTAVSEIEDDIEAVVDDRLASIPELTDRVIQGEVTTF